MARIRALLRTQPAAGPSYEQAPLRITPPPHAWQSPPAPPLANSEPLAFPPGSGVRFTIGRTRDCDLCLADLSVSRMHALLVRREDGWVLSDLGSHNGTRLNGWLVREAVRLELAILNPEWTIVFNPRRKTLDCVFTELRAEVRRLFIRCGQIKSPASLSS